MPVHETKGGWKYGNTGKTYPDKKSAIKQALAIAYSRAEEKGKNKPSQDDVRKEISGEESVEKTAAEQPAEHDQQLGYVAGGAFGALIHKLYPKGIPSPTQPPVMKYEVRPEILVRESLKQARRTYNPIDTDVLGISRGEENALRNINLAHPITYGAEGRAASRYFGKLAEDTARMQYHPVVASALRSTPGKRDAAKYDEANSVLRSAKRMGKRFGETFRPVQQPLQKNNSASIIYNVNGKPVIDLPLLVKTASAKAIGKIGLQKAAGEASKHQKELLQKSGLVFHITPPTNYDSELEPIVGDLMKNASACPQTIGFIRKLANANKKQ